jgi:hypothetical protein
MWLTWFFKTKKYKKKQKSKKPTHQQSLHVIDGASVIFPPWVRAPLMRWGLEKKREKSHRPSTTTVPSHSVTDI